VDRGGLSGQHAAIACPVVGEARRTFSDMFLHGELIARIGRQEEGGALVPLLAAW
jgi:hypothetical protein